MHVLYVKNVLKKKKEKKQELDIYFEEYIDEFGNESYRTPDSIVFSCVLLEIKYFKFKGV